MLILSSIIKLLNYENDTFSLDQLALIRASVPNQHTKLLTLSIIIWLMKLKLV